MQTVSAPKILELAPEDESELRSTATHEVGHTVVADHLKLKPQTFISGRRCGICLHERGTAEQNSCVSWGGCLAQRMFASDKGESFTQDDLRQFYREVMDRGVRLSKEDRDGIASFPIFEPLQKAYKILSDNISLLKFLASVLVAESRERVHQSIARSSDACDELEIGLFTMDKNREQREKRWQETLRELAEKAEDVPMPARWPATFGDFQVRVVVGNGSRDEAVENVRSFHRFMLETKAGGRAKFFDEVWQFFESSPLSENEYRWLAVEFRHWCARRRETATKPQSRKTHEQIT